MGYMRLVPLFWLKGATSGTKTVQAGLCESSKLLVFELAKKIKLAK